MPSFRVTMSIGALRPGIAPGAILPAAASAARELAIVEASDLAVVAGEARITVRFAADEAEIAEQIADHVVAVTGQLATVARWQITKRVKGAWLPPFA